MCRSFLSRWEDENGVEVHDGRNNLGVVSINLPRLGIRCGGDLATFWSMLDEQLEVAHDALKQRIKRFETVQAKTAPILYTEGALGVKMDPEDYVIDLFRNGRASVSLGYIGINETVNAIFGDGIPMFESESKQELGHQIVQYLADACKEWKTDEGWGYSLYSTPSESLCNRFCELDTARYGKLEGVTDKDYYTNSFHLDVTFKTDPYSKIRFEEAYPVMASGGFINYVELPDMSRNMWALEDIWDYAYKHVGYFGLNMPVDQCFECGFHGDFSCTNKGFTCPSCGNRDDSKMNVIRRVSGYLSAPNARPFNKGKQSEVMKRVKHM